jgi:hypothetical protein
MESRTKLRVLVTVGLALAVGLVLPVSAQVSTGTIEINTVDEQALPLPGVTGRVVNTETGAQRASVSDVAGMIIVPALPPGEYNVGVELPGFAPANRDVTIRIGQTARLVFTMKVQMSETITVTGEAPVVDVLKTDSSTNITPEQIQDLPVPSREFERLAYIAPGTNRERGGYRFIQNSVVVGSGGNASQTTFMVDGVELTDQALGLSRARFSMDAIREFRVVTARFDPEIGGSQGGALSVATKSGGNEIHGSVFGFYRGADLRAAGALDQTKNDEFQRYQVGFTLGGPITRDKMHYFLSFEQIGQDDITLFRPGGLYAGLAEDVPDPSDQTLALVSFDNQFSASSSAFAKGVFERFNLDNFRVGGVSAESHGQTLKRENWNVIVGWTKVIGDGDHVNELRMQGGSRYYEEPTNSDALEEWFTSGTTLQIGTNTVGDLEGDGTYFELRDTYHWHLTGNRSTHDLKMGGAWMHIDERSDIPVYQNGTMLYLTDDRSLPLAYVFGIGSADVKKKTDLFGVFINDDWRPLPNFTLSMGVRYDYDTQGNNPDFDASPLVGPRSVDSNNVQPRVGFNWDLNNDGKNILRGGFGWFVGRYLLVPAFTELQQNGTTGRVIYQNVNGLFYGLPPAYWLDPSNPQNTGVPAPASATILQNSLAAPEQFQASLGFTHALGSTGLYVDLEGIYANGDDEIAIRDTNWGGNSNPVSLNPAWDQINTYGNYGHSEYYAAILSVNGMLGPHIITSSLTWADKKNISDDFSPVFPYGYPSDPADIEAEYGRSRGTEDLRLVLSGVFRLPANFNAGVTYIYGTGQPWNPIYGYDYNGDGKNSDRMPGVARNSGDGPRFSQLNLRISWTLGIKGGSGLEFIAEAFNLFNTVNYDVASIDTAEFFSGPTLLNPNLPYVSNPGFGQYRATLDPLEVQLGVRWQF